MDVNLPSQQAAQLAAQEPVKLVEHSSHNSMQVIFGGAIIVLAVVIAGIVCVLGNVRIPYLSNFYAPAIVVPSTMALPVVDPSVPVAASTTSIATSTATTTTKKK
jgi:hypothetical protein